MTNTVPLDARLLGNAVMELNIARHILSLYTREHQLVQLSLDKTFTILSDLFELRPEIALAVAKDTLIVDGRHLDPKNPVFREFALALSRMSIATLSFVKGLSREEVYDFFRFLSRDATGISSETLPHVLEEYRLRHILIEPLDYRAFSFAEDRAKRDGSDEYLLERYIKALLDGELPSDGVQAVVENVEPGTLAVLMNQAGGEIAREASYDTVVSSYLRGGAGRPISGGDLQRLLTFIAGLRPELKQQFLTSSVKAIAHDPAVLSQALEGVSVDSIIEFVREIDQNRVALPAALGTLIARFSRTGLELPGGGLNVDDVLLSPEVASLFKEDAGHQHGPESYQAEIQRIVEAQTAVAANPDRSELAHELDEDYVRYCHANALLALLDSSLPGLVTLEDEDPYAAAFIALAGHSVETGQYAQLLELLTRFDDLQRRGRHPATVRSVREHCVAAEFVAAIVDSLRRHGRADRAGAAMVCGFYGSAIVPPLFDASGAEERMHVRKLLLQLLVGLGEHMAREAPLRLSGQALARAAQHAVPARRKRCAARPRAPGPAGRRQRPAGATRVRPLPRAGRRGGWRADSCARCCTTRATASPMPPSRRRAHWASGNCSPTCVALIRKPTGGDGLRQRLRAVRALGQLGGDQASAALRELLTLRVSLFPGETRRFRSAVRRVLKPHPREAARARTPGADPAGEKP